MVRVQEFIAVVLCLVPVFLFASDGKDSLWEKQVDGLEFSQPSILVFTGSDWCRNCMKLHDLILTNTEFNQAASSSFSLFLVDLPRAKKHQPAEQEWEARKELALRFNPSGIFPLIVVVSSDGSIVQSTKYLGETIDPYLKWLEEVKGKV